MRESHNVVIVGAGQAGLSLSHELRGFGVEHIVLERGRIANTWRGRWDTFCLVTPNWTVRVPGGEYDGPDPDGFMPRDSIVEHLEAYALSFLAPVREGVSVTGLDRAGDRFLLRTSAGEIEARTVVLATGAFQQPHVPEAARGLPPSIPIIDATAYTKPAALPPGRVLIVGSAQTGCQLAEDLRLAGREVVVACGRAPWAPRRLEGRDLVSWIYDTPFMDQALADLPSPLARLGGNIQSTGRDGGHDLNYRVLQDLGVALAGRLAGADADRVYFADDLAESVAFGDARYADVRALIAKTCAERGTRAPEFPMPPPFAADAPRSLPVRDFGAVVITSGFRPDYGWVRIDAAFDEHGFPVQTDGASAAAPGLFFIGVHFLRKRKSALLNGVDEDAAVVAAQVAARSGVAV